MAARTGKAKLAGVIGRPVGHSLSPALHEYWLKRYGIDGAYVPLEVPDGHFMETLHILSVLGFRGANVTLPYKEKAFAAAASSDETARLTGAVNTLLRRDDGSFAGSNTDVYGFLESLRAGGIAPESVRSAVILGAGGAARGIAVGLARSGCGRITVINRTRGNAEALRTQLLATGLPCRVDVAPWERRTAVLENTELLVNTTALGMSGQPPLELDISALPLSAAVADIIYTPLKTALLKAGEGRGHKTIGGLWMLIHQAAPGFEAWFGVKPEVTPELHDYLVSLITP